MAGGREEGNVIRIRGGGRPAKNPPGLGAGRVDVSDMDRRPYRILSRILRVLMLCSVMPKVAGSTPKARAMSSVK